MKVNQESDVYLSSLYPLEYNASLLLKAMRAAEALDELHVAKTGRKL